MKVSRERGRKRQCVDGRMIWDAAAVGGECVRVPDEMK